jgi:hypothetical protein
MHSFGIALCRETKASAPAHTNRNALIFSLLERLTISANSEPIVSMGEKAV